MAMKDYGRIFALLLIALFITISITVQPALVNAQTSSPWKTQLVDYQGAFGSLALDSNGNPHIIYYRETIGNDTWETRYDTLNYAVWTGTKWTTLIIDPEGAGGVLALDSNGRPHVLYYTVSNSSYGYDLKYAVLNNENWKIEALDTPISSSHYAMVLDSNGYPNIAYTTYTYDENHTAIFTVKYAFWNGEKWSIQPVDEGAMFGGVSSIALDSNNYPHMVYHESNNIRYAYWNNSGWLKQTLFSNSTANNLLINSNGQPSFCYTTTNSTFRDFFSVNYAYWDGNSWQSRPIDENVNPYRNGRIYLNYLGLDNLNNPQLFFYTRNNEDSKYYITLNIVKWNGLEWAVKNLGGIPTNRSFYEGTMTIADIAYNSNGTVDLTYYGVTGTVRSAYVYRSLTYASLDTTSLSNPGSQGIYLFGLDWVKFSILVFMGIVVAVVVVVAFKTLSKKRNASTKN
jgi:hypothetical protein